MSPRLWPVAAALVLCACAAGPDFKRPAPPVSSGYGADTPLLAADQELPRQWWRGFGSPQLDAMVAEALKANPDLKSAEAALRQAREQSRAAAGALLPSLDAGYQAQRARTSAALSPVLADNSDLYSLHTAQVTVSYALDVFGAARRSAESARAQAESQDFQHRAAASALVANVVAAAMQEASLRQQLAAAQAQADAGRTVLDFTRKQAALGALGPADVAAQETTVAQAEQALPPLRKAWAAQRTALQVLLGREAGQAPAAGIDLDRLVLPANLPLVAPAELVRRRPDIRAAEANLHAASAGVGVAIAARLPSLTLSAQGGGASAALQTLTSGPNGFWTLSAGVTQPIFEGGALLHRQKAAEAAFEQAKAQYRSTVLTALKTVADALDALARDGEALRAAQTAQDAADRSLGFSRRQLALGQIGALTERGAEQADAQARSARIAATAARYADTAALYQALGAATD